jgi:hypothetical protein
MRSLFKPWSFQDRLALTVRIILFAQLVTCLFQCVLGVFEALRADFIRANGYKSYVATSNILHAVGKPLGAWTNIAVVAFPLALFTCLFFALKADRIPPLKQVYLYVLCWLSVALAIFQFVADSLTNRD